MGHFFQVSFGQSFCFACFWVCIWFISGFSHLYAHLSSSWTPVKRPVGRLSITLLVTSFLICLVRKISLTWEWEICCFLSGQDPAYSLDFPAIDILEFLSTRNEPQLLSVWRRKGIYLLPQFYQGRTSEKTMAIYNLIESQRQAEWKIQLQKIIYCMFSFMCNLSCFQRFWVRRMVQLLRNNMGGVFWGGDHVLVLDYGMVTRIYRCVEIY